MTRGRWCPAADTAAVLECFHYLGATKRGEAFVDDEAGVVVFAAPTSRALPKDWLELTRWCITSNGKNAGSTQWGRAVRALRERRPEVTTVVSYSDPSAGHTGALYRACNWWWAPTWHRLRPPPTGNGRWAASAKTEAVKDRWVFPLRRDARRAEVLTARDESALRRWPMARYVEPGGADFRAWRRAVEADA